MNTKISIFFIKTKFLNIFDYLISLNKTMKTIFFLLNLYIKIVMNKNIQNIFN